MLNLIRAAFAVLVLSLPITAEERMPVPGIEAVIGSQIEAFRADDFAAAFTYASPVIKGAFGTPERFGAMVREGYPMVYRPSEVKFLDLREIGGTLWQKVMVRDAGGAYHMLDYEMVPAEGDWQINAVQLLQAEQLGA